MRLGEEFHGSARHAIMLMKVYTATLQVLVDILPLVQELLPQII